MGSHFFLLHFPFITLIIFLAVSPSNGEDANYTACSTPYSCGKIQNIDYPFWGENRPKYCGLPDFKLSCKGNKITSFSVFKNLDFALSVHGINTSSQTIVFSLKKLSESCFLQNRTVTILPTLQLIGANTTINLLYGCNDMCVSKYESRKSFTCATYRDGTKGTAYYFGTSAEVRRIGDQCSCKNNVSIPVDNKVLDELRSTNASLQSILTGQLIETKYNVKIMNSIYACASCKASGGRCGSSGDSLSDQFVCYCQNGNHPSVCPPKSEQKFKVILGSGIAAFAGAIIVLVVIIAIWHRKKLFVTRSASLGCNASELEKGSIYFGVPLFSYSELVEATANFDQSNELGSGGYGIVFYGKLKDGREVAVKRLYEKSYKRVEQFMNEVQILTHLRHQNLVSLFGCTSHHCKELLLVYEYVKNGTVSDHLYGENSKSVSLSWPVRLRIAMETATALSYLHASDIIHRDVKTNNILLDSNFCVKVADFGLSRLFPTDVTHVSTAPQGTPGYLDPEYHQCYQLTNKSDVYSFGVVLSELISSLPAVDMDRHKHEINLSNFAMNRIQRCAFDELVDPQLGFAIDFKVRRMITSVAELAFQCLQHDKELRPPMDEVLEVLKRIESMDYEALSQAEEAAKVVEGTVKMHTSNPPSTPAEDDHAQLLSNHQEFSSSPISVMGKWVSRSTMSSISK